MGMHTVRSARRLGLFLWPVVPPAALASTIIGGGIAAVAGVVTSVPLMRLGGLAASIATFALLVIVHTVAQNLNQVTNGLSGMAGVPTTTTPGNALAWCVIAMVVIYVFQESRIGLRLRAAREYEVAARACGVRVFSERRVAWVISAFFMGIGGALYAQFLGTFDADAFYLDISFLVIAMLVVGGRNSLAGAVVGGTFISIVAEGLRRIAAGAHIGPLYIPGRPGVEAVGLGAIMLIVLIVRPSGLAGGREVTWPFTRAMRTAGAAQEQR